MSAPLMPTDDYSRASWDLNDTGNGDRFVARHRDRFLYVRGLGWHSYNGKAWIREGADEAALLAASATATAIKDEAEALFTAAKRDGVTADVAAKLNARGARVKEWAETSGSHPRCMAMLRFAAAKLACPLEDFDRDPYAINVQNGTLRFFQAPPVRDSERSTWQVRLDPHMPSDRITRICAFAYVDNASADVWKSHLERCIPDPFERLFLMRMIGYCALGLNGEQVFFIWQGKGGDGKSVTAGAVRQVLGSYAAKVDVKTFLEERSSRSAAQASPDIARLAGATRFVTASEPAKGSRLNEALVKDITGGAPLVARHLNKDPFEFLPRFKFVIDCNPLPGIGGADDGIWRRIVLLPWREQLKREEMDPQIETKLVSEGEGLLAAIVKGAIAYLDRGLDPPATLNAARQDYRAGSNPFRDWLDTFTVFDREHECRHSELYGSYKDEQERVGNEKVKSSVMFGRELTELQVMKFREGGTGQIMRRGLRLLSEPERTAAAAAASTASLHQPSQPITPEMEEGFVDDFGCTVDEADRSIYAFE